MARVLVAGGAGFLGSQLCRRLLDQGDEVICVDNVYTGFKKNIHKVASNPNFEFLRHDVCFPLFVEVDAIYNLACPASPEMYQKDPVQTLKTSVLGSINLLGLAKRTGARILQASTSEIYGDPLVSPQKESYWGNVNPSGVRSCYDEGKRCAETLFTDYHRQHGVDTRIARIFNTYGPCMSSGDGRVVSNFVSQALKNHPITIYGDGSQTRSFCFVSDMLDGLTALMASDLMLPVNLGNPRELSILEVAETIIKMTRSRSQISFYPLPVDDPRRRCPDIRLAEEKLGFSPKVDFEEGVSRTIEWFREEYSFEYRS